VRHVSGGISAIGLKSYEQGRKSFEVSQALDLVRRGAAADCFGEMVIRTMTTSRHHLADIHAPPGMSEVVKGFVEPEKGREKWYKQAAGRTLPTFPKRRRRRLSAPRCRTNSRRA